MDFASILASLASLCAFHFYVRWHWELVFLQQKGAPLPFWPRWGAVDGLSLARYLLFLAACGLAWGALYRRAWLIAIPALVLAFFLAFFLAATALLLT